MTEKTKPGAPFLRVIENPDFVDPVEEEARALADRLVADYTAMSKQTGASFRYCIEVPKFPESDKVVDRTVAILGQRNWSADPVEHNCAGGRAGAFWLQPPSNWQASASA